jgi:hypothetical protein
LSIPSSTEKVHNPKNLPSSKIKASTKAACRRLSSILLLNPLSFGQGKANFGLQSISNSPASTISSGKLIEIRESEESFLPTDNGSTHELSVIKSTMGDMSQSWKSTINSRKGGMNSF